MAEPPILTLSEIRLTFGGTPLFDDLSLSIAPGDRLAIVGRNGSGKSTLMKVMAGLAQADSGERFLRPGLTVAYMEQDPDMTGCATLADHVAAGLPEDATYRAGMAIDGLGLDGSIRVDAASGGERRRAALARLVAADPDLMLIDEPTNHLDIAGIGWLESYLKDTRKAFAVISHDRAFLRSLTRATLWLDRGQARRLERGFAHFEDWRDKVFEEEDIARHKLDRLIKAEGRWAVEGISARRKRNMGRVRRLQEMRAERAAEIRRAGTAKLEIDAGAVSGRKVIEAKGLTYSAGPRLLLKDVSITVTRGERLALVGPNGAGKTTLVNLLTGRLPPQAGSVVLGTGLEMAVFDQNRAALDPEASLWQSLTDAEGLAVSGRSDQVMVRGSPRHVVAYLKDFLFSEAQARGPVKALSGGEKARLLLARLLARPSNLLVLDEPTNDLDIETLDLMEDVLAGFDGTVILVSHDRDFIDRVATTAVVLPGDGRAVIHAGGLSDWQAALPAPLPPSRPSRAPTADAPPPRPDRKDGEGTGPGSDTGADTGAVRAAPRRLGFAQAHRLKQLPDEIARLEADIARLSDLLSDPDLFARDPGRFAKAGAALAQRQAALTAAEDEWLELESLRESGGA
jgi:ATP-binding cassette subfamily F protein uup